jgi:lysophospholipase L1-like esterase
MRDAPLSASPVSTPPRRSPAWARAVLAALLLAAAVGGSNSTAGQPHGDSTSGSPTPPPRVRVIGDSIAESQTPELRGGWAKYLDVILPPENAGTALAVLDDLPAFVPPDDPVDVILWNNGIHDTRSDSAFAEYADNIRRLGLALKATGSRVIFINTTPLSEDTEGRIDTINREAARVMAELDIPLIDLHDFSMDLGPEVRFDGVHYRNTAARLQAGYIQSELARLGIEVRMMPE